jgi:hypothetical protein
MIEFMRSCKQNMRLCFIISHYYVRRYKSYVQIYIERINSFYPDSLVIIVDNQSEHLIDIRDKMRGHQNVAVIVNKSDCMFEVGAYKEGIRFLVDCKVLHKFDYVVFSQDTFVANRKYDFASLKARGVQAAGFNHLFGWCDMQEDPIVQRVLTSLDLFSLYDGVNFSLCWCNSFVLSSTRVLDFYEIVKFERIYGRYSGSVQSERYLAGILYYLNANSYVTLCGDAATKESLGYDCWNVDIANNELSHAFVKEVQQKREDTR